MVKKGLRVINVLGVRITNFLLTINENLASIILIADQFILVCCDSWHALFKQVGEFNKCHSYFAFSLKTKGMLYGRQRQWSSYLEKSASYLCPIAIFPINESWMSQKSSSLITMPP